MGVVNREYKDRLFNFIFGAEENKAWALSLYNAVSGADYTDPSLVKFNTIREILYLSMHNDLSFLIADEVNVYEQQSTYNPNMPLRMLQIIGSLYEKYTKERKMNKYGSKLLELPAPKLVVFYNGRRGQGDEAVLHLSDAFPEGAEGDVEVSVRVININFGRSRGILQNCKPLGEYAWLIEEIRSTQKDVGMEAAIDRAMQKMPDDFVIKAFLQAHIAEVKGMLFDEYNEAEAMALFKEEGRAEGRMEGRAEGRMEGRAEGRMEGRAEGRTEGRQEGFLEAMLSLAREGLISISLGASRAGISEEAFRKQMAMP